MKDNVKNICVVVAMIGLAAVAAYLEVHGHDAPILWLGVFALFMWLLA